MWWNLWERRRGERSKQEQSIEESERNQIRLQWEIETKGVIERNKVMEKVENKPKKKEKETGPKLKNQNIK